MQVYRVEIVQVNAAVHIHVNYDAPIHVFAAQRRLQEAWISIVLDKLDNVRIIFHYI